MRASSMYSAGAIEARWTAGSSSVASSSIQATGRKEERIESWDRGGRTNELYSAVSFFFCCKHFCYICAAAALHMPSLPIVTTLRITVRYRSRKTSLLLPPPSPCKLAAQCHAKFTRVHCRNMHRNASHVYISKQMLQRCSKIDMYWFKKLLLGIYFVTATFPTAIN